MLKTTLALVAALTLTADLQAQQPSPPRSPNIDSLKQLSIDELSEQDVTSASRRVEQFANVPYAVQVITSDDLRRLGVTSVTQALRLADALHVSQVFGPQFAVSSRGFAISTSNKMLVQIDGRSVYSPVFAGVFWEVQDVVIADIERIEIVRGPGASVWGANAVNGVINIIMKRAVDTRGTFVGAAAGTNMTGPLEVRHGGRLGAAGSFRVYGKFRAEDDHQLASGVDAGDDFRFGQGGFRVESAQTDDGFAFVQGDIYRGSTGLVGSDDRSTLIGGNALARMTRGTAGLSESRAQVYFERTWRRVPDQYRGTLNTFDVDLQHLENFGRHVVIGGAGYRVYDGDDFAEGTGFFFDPQHRRSHRFNLFVQDEIEIAPSSLFITVGTKLERNEFTGFELQPTVRGRWNPTRDQTAWASVSRAVRVPSRFDTDLRILAPTGRVVLSGSEDFKSETLIAYEAGYRVRFNDRVSIDVAAFNNRYDDLRSQELPSSATDPVVLRNMLNAVTKGVEIGSTVQVAPWWQAHGSYVHGWQRFTVDPGSRDVTGGNSEHNDPSDIFKFRSSITALERLEIDGIFRYVGALPHPVVASYAQLEGRIGWRLRPGQDFSVIGRNLLTPRHIEFAAGTPLETFERSVTARYTCRF